MAGHRMDGTTIANVRHKGQEDRANAALIVQAPAMLKALKQIVEFVETFDSFDVAHPAERTRLTRAKAAIAAAERPGATQS